MWMKVIDVETEAVGPTTTEAFLSKSESERVGSKRCRIGRVVRRCGRMEERV